MIRAAATVVPGNGVPVRELAGGHDQPLVPPLPWLPPAAPPPPAEPPEPLPVPPEPVAPPEAVAAPEPPAPPELVAPPDAVVPPELVDPPDAVVPPEALPPEPPPPPEPVAPPDAGVPPEPLLPEPLPPEPLPPLPAPAPPPELQPARAVANTRPPPTQSRRNFEFIEGWAICGRVYRAAPRTTNPDAERGTKGRSRTRAPDARAYEGRAFERLTSILAISARRAVPAR